MVAAFREFNTRRAGPQDLQSRRKAGLRLPLQQQGAGGEQGFEASGKVGLDRHLVELRDMMSG
jgi:hypothetical protein